MPCIEQLIFKHGPVLKSLEEAERIVSMHPSLKELLIVSEVLPIGTEHTAPGGAVIRIIDATSFDVDEHLGF